MNAYIIVATHKEYAIPQDALYLPVQAGAAIHPALPYTGDNIGENISEKNATFCELTALFWAWKNLDADYLGLCHYRRYFAEPCRGILRSESVVRVIRRSFLSAESAECLLKKTTVILPVKRNYFIETGYSQYAHAHHEEDLIAVREILAVKYPNAIQAFDSTLRRVTGHRFNMFIMRRDLLDAYCAWLFDILFELEKRLDISSYSDYDKRVFGFIGERLLDVWIETNHILYRELPVLHTESQHWLYKGTAFLKRKCIGKNNNSAGIGI